MTRKIVPQKTSRQTKTGFAVSATAKPGTTKRSPRQSSNLTRSSTIKRTKQAQKPNKPVHPKAKMTFRRNVIPPLLGILMTAGLLGLLNGQWISAQYQYRFMHPVDASSLAALPVSADPQAQARIYIPSINVSAPMITDEKSYLDSQVQLALRRGVVQYGSSIDPGHVGNTVIVGHSSGQLWAPGEYKFVFTLLDKVAKNDRIFVDFKGIRYIYRVSSIKIVPPTDLSVLQPSDEPLLTLITCTPVGTNRDRLVVSARQVSPDPKTATPVDANKIRPVTTTVIPN